MLDRLNSFANPYPIHCVYADGSTAPTPEGYPERITKWYEAEYMIQGKGYVLMDGIKYPAHAGTVFLRPPGIRNQGFLPYHSYLLLFDLQASPAKAASYHNSSVLNDPGMCRPAGESAYYLEARDPSFVQSLFRSCCLHFSEHSEPGLLHAKADLLELFAYFCVCREAPDSLGRTLRLHQSAILEIRKKIAENPAGDYSLNQFAAECGLSPSFLCRVFKESTGQTLFQYLTETRVRHAKMLLIDTSLPIKDICRQSGFRNESYFYRVFRQSTAVSPVRFREMHRL